MALKFKLVVNFFVCVIKTCTREFGIWWISSLTIRLVATSVLPFFVLHCVIR